MEYLFYMNIRCTSGDFSSQTTNLPENWTLLAYTQELQRSVCVSNKEHRKQSFMEAHTPSEDILRAARQFAERVSCKAGINAVEVKCHFAPGCPAPPLVRQSCAPLRSKTRDSLLHSGSNRDLRLCGGNWQFRLLCL